MGGHTSGKAGSSGATPAINPDVAGITPSEMQTAYGVNLISFGSVAGTGAGQTIAIIDAYHDPNIISDANTFSRPTACRSSTAAADPLCKC